MHITRRYTPSTQTKHLLTFLKEHIIMMNPKEIEMNIRECIRPLDLTDLPPSHLDLVKKAIQGNIISFVKKLQSKVYKIELVSHWTNFTEKEIEEIIERAFNRDTKDQISIDVQRQ